MSNFNVNGYSPSKPIGNSVLPTTNTIDFNLKSYVPRNEIIKVNGEKDSIELDSFTDEVDVKSQVDVSDESIFFEEIYNFFKKTGITRYADFNISLVRAAIGEFLNRGEGVVDSHIYATTKAINATRLDKAFGWEKGYDDKIIGFDVSGKVEDSIDYIVIDKDAKYVNVADVIGTFVGKLGGYAALALVPYVGKVLTTFAGAGVKTEESINEQLEETGCVNDWEVFGHSLIGSLEGFAYGKMSKSATTLKEIGLKNVASGAKQMFAGGFKNGMINFGKSIPEVFKNTGLASLKDPSTWSETAARVGEKVLSVIKDGDVSFGDLFVFSKRYFDNMGSSGMTYIDDFAKEVIEEIVD